MRDTQCHACTYEFRRDKSWHLGTKFLNISKVLSRHGPHYFTWPASPRIPKHTVTSSSCIGTPNCVPSRKPFTVPLWGLLRGFSKLPELGAKGGGAEAEPRSRVWGTLSPRCLSILPKYSDSIKSVINSCLQSYLWTRLRLVKPRSCP